MSGCITIIIIIIINELLAVRTHPVNTGTIIRIENYFQYTHSRRTCGWSVYFVPDSPSCGEIQRPRCAAPVPSPRPCFEAPFLPRAAVPAALPCFSLGEVQPQPTKASFLQPPWIESPKGPDALITRPLLRSLPLRPTAPKANRVRRVISAHFRLRRLSQSTTALDGEMEPFKLWKKKNTNPWYFWEFELTASTFEYRLFVRLIGITGGKIICTKNKNCKITAINNTFPHERQ